MFRSYATHTAVRQDSRRLIVDAVRWFYYGSVFNEVMQ
jgi:hypothetical protein